MTVPILEKILQKLELRCLAEVDSSGMGAIDYADPGSEGQFLTRDAFNSLPELRFLVGARAFVLNMSDENAGPFVAPYKPC